MSILGPVTGLMWNYDEGFYFQNNPGPGPGPVSPGWTITWTFEIALDKPRTVYATTDVSEFASAGPGGGYTHIISEILWYSVSGQSKQKQPEAPSILDEKVVDVIFAYGGAAEADPADQQGSGAYQMWGSVNFQVWLWS
jgi:hypothetical protein